MATIDQIHQQDDIDEHTAHTTDVYHYHIQLHSYFYHTHTHNGATCDTNDVVYHEQWTGTTHKLFEPPPLPLEKCSVNLEKKRYEGCQSKGQRKYGVHTVTSTPIHK